MGCYGAKAYGGGGNGGAGWEGGEVRETSDGRVQGVNIFRRRHSRGFAREFIVFRAQLPRLLREHERKRRRKLTVARRRHGSTTTMENERREPRVRAGSRSRDARSLIRTSVFRRVGSHDLLNLRVGCLYAYRRMLAKFK